MQFVNRILLQVKKVTSPAADPAELIKAELQTLIILFWTLKKNIRINESTLVPYESHIDQLKLVDCFSRHFNGIAI